MLLLYGLFPERKVRLSEMHLQKEEREREREREREHLQKEENGSRVRNNEQLLWRKIVTFESAN